jgi:hypothetical protein
MMDKGKRQNLLKEIGVERLENELSISEWERISKSGKLLEGFIREFQEKLHWDTLSIYQKMSENFIREFIHKIDWFFISEYQQLSESFIREYSDKVDWYSISETHIFSDGFMEEFKENISWKKYFKENYVNYSIIKKYIFRTDIKSTEQFKSYHLSEAQKCEINKLLKLKHMF